MRSARSLVAVAAVILAVSGCSASPAAAAHKAFKLDKKCASNFVCTVVSSDIAAIPPGTVLNYTDVGDGSTKQQTITFTTKDGSASGFCDFNFDGNPLVGQCTFLSGTGALTGFHLVGDVTATGDQNSPVFHWAGTYWFGD